MKFKFKFNNRFNVYVAVIACGAALWVCMQQFHLPGEQYIQTALICLFLLVALVVVAGLVAFSIRYILDKIENQRHGDP